MKPPIYVVFQIFICNALIFTLYNGMPYVYIVMLKGPFKFLSGIQWKLNKEKVTVFFMSLEIVFLHVINKTT